MWEQIRASVLNVVVESTIESAVLWAMALLFLQWYKHSSPRMREVLFLLPLFIPVALTTVFHVILPLATSVTVDAKPVGALVSDWFTPSTPIAWLFFATAALGTAACLTFAWRLWRGWRQAHSLWQRQQEEGSSLHTRCDASLRALASQARLPLPRLVLIEGRRAGSLAFGSRGYILVPKTLALRLDEEELQALLAHELAHIVRWDGLLDSAAQVCRNLMLFNPLAYLALSRFRREREEAADDAAVRIGGNRLALASCLIQAYRLRGASEGPVITGLLGCEGGLERRVQRMVSASDLQEPSKVAWLGLGALAAVVTLALGVLL